ncbi:hypothetical protein D3C87_1733900 [compost metagenome]
MLAATNKPRPDRINLRLSMLAVSAIRIGVQIAYTSEKIVINCPPVASETPNESEMRSKIPDTIYSDVPTKKLIMAKI